MRCALLLIGILFQIGSVPDEAIAAVREQFVPILSVTTDERPTGSVVYVKARFEARPDGEGLVLRFHDSPGRFSTLAQLSTARAIKQAAASLGLSTDSWTIDLRVPYDGVTVSGESLSAMISLTIAALAQGKTVQTGHVLTGTVKPDGAIGPVGGVPFKVQAAKSARLRLVLIPQQQTEHREQPEAESDMRILAVRSIPEALEALTGEADAD
ncbi:MAG TPA: S16 family serine protease [Nitrospira sp.]|nr:S16 family serine protease [Nitrospira sp.]